MLLIAGTAPVFAQGFLDRMKEDAERRAENKAVRDAENPQPAQKAACARRTCCYTGAGYTRSCAVRVRDSRGAGHAGTGAVRSSRKTTKVLPGKRAGLHFLSILNGQAGEMRQLLYVSNTLSDLAPGALDDILTASRRNNAMMGITGPAAVY